MYIKPFPLPLNKKKYIYTNIIKTLIFSFRILYFIFIWLLKYFSIAYNKFHRL